MSNPTLFVPIANITADGAFNTRKRKDPAALERLKNSIAANGMLQNVGIRRREPNGPYFLLWGFRRFEAARMAGLKEVPVKDMGVMSDARALEENMRENLEREELSHYDRAHGFLTLTANGYTDTQISERLSAASNNGEPLARTTVLNDIRLAKGLHPTIQKEWEAGHPAASVKALLSIISEPQEKQLEAWKARVESMGPINPTTGKPKRQRGKGKKKSATNPKGAPLTSDEVRKVCEEIQARAKAGTLVYATARDIADALCDAVETGAGIYFGIRGCLDAAPATSHTETQGTPKKRKGNKAKSKTASATT